MAKSVQTKMVTKNALRYVELAKIQFDPSYQRDVVPKHKLIVAGFNPDALGIPLIAEREDGSLWCVDGRQRITALIKLGKTRVRAEVFASKGPEAEAEVFRLVNLNRTKLRVGEIFQALLTAGDETVWLLKNTVEKCGFRIPPSRSGRHTGSPELAAKEVKALKSLMPMVARHGAAPVEFILNTIKAAWPGDPQGTTSNIVDALGCFWNQNDGNIDIERLITRLSKTTPAKIIYQSGLGTEGRALNGAAVITRLYKKRK